MFTIRGRRPKTCLDCPCCHFGENGAWDYCQARPNEDKYSFQAEKQTERPKWCPIVVDDIENNKCGDCKWLCGNESTVGIACLHPDRPFYSLACDTAKFKYKSTRACKRFERKEKEDDIH